MKKLEAQIAGADDPGAKAVGILLREICRMSPQAAELVEQDLENKGMSIQECYGFLFAYAKKHKTKCCWACPVIGIDPENDAVKVILDFYGIPSAWVSDNVKTPLVSAFGAASSPASAAPAGENLAQQQESQAARHAPESLDLLDLL